MIIIKIQEIRKSAPKIRIKLFMILFMWFESTKPLIRIRSTKPKCYLYLIWVNHICDLNQTSRIQLMECRDSNQTKRRKCYFFLSYVWFESGSHKVIHGLSSHFDLNHVRRKYESHFQNLSLMSKGSVIQNSNLTWFKSYSNVLLDSKLWQFN